MQDFNELKIQFEELRITLKVLQNRVCQEFILYLFIILLIDCYINTN